MSITFILQIILIVSIVSESMAGALSAARKGMDPIGVTVIAFATSLGGGTMRDVFFDNYPLLWVRWPELVWLVIVIALVTMLIRRYMKRLLGLFLALDAIGLCGLTIIGLEKSLASGHGFTISVVAALLTGVFGGVLRDILCGDIPWIFRKEFYATVSLYVAGTYLLLTYYTPIPGIAILMICMISGIALRLFSVRYKITLPLFHYSD